MRPTRLAAVIAVSVASATAVVPHASAARPVESSVALPPPADSVAGDIDGDGQSDLVIGSDSGIEVRYTSASPGGSHIQDIPLPAGTLSEASAYGLRNVVVGDFNGDGYADVAAATPTPKKDDGAVYVWYGGPSGLDPAKVVTIAGPAGARDGFGGTLLAGNLNGDGDTDLVVTNSTGVDGRVNRDITLLFGSSAGLSKTHDRVLDYPNMVSDAIGDFNHDGHPDLAVSKPGPGDNGRIAVFLGTKHGISTKAKVITGLHPTDGEALGTPLVAGKVNGGKYTDLVAGAPGATVAHQAGAGKVVVLFGGKHGLSGAHTAQVSAAAKGVPGAPQQNAAFGLYLALGDVNGDGFGDLLIATTRDDTSSSVGEFYVVRGTKSSITGHHAQRFTESTSGVPGTPGSPDDYFGSSIEAFHPAGSTYAAVAVGAPGANFVDVFAGSATGLSTTGAVQYADSTPDNFGESLAQ